MAFHQQELISLICHYLLTSLPFRTTLLVFHRCVPPPKHMYISHAIKLQWKYKQFGKLHFPKTHIPLYYYLSFLSHKHKTSGDTLHRVSNIYELGRFQCHAVVVLEFGPSQTTIFIPLWFWYVINIIDATTLVLMGFLL